MPTNAPTTPAPSEVVILSRLLLKGKAGLTADQARYLLGLAFGDEDKARMHELAVKNQEGTIFPEELRELDSYVKAGELLAILQAQARRFLNRKKK